MRRHLGLALIGTATVFFFAIFVWPTQWRYFTLGTGTSEVPLRSHRFTDATQRLTLDGWVSQDKLAPGDLSTPKAPEELQGLLSGTSQDGIEIQKKSVTDTGYIHVSVYNGSSKKIASLKLEVRRTDGGAPRLFDVPMSVGPQEAKLVDFSSGLESEHVGEVRLVSVENSPE